MRIVGILLIFAVMLGCSKGKKNAPNPEPEPTVNKPGKSELLSPANNEVCASGTVISANQSSITFDWKDEANSTSYELYLKNLASGNTIKFDSQTSGITLTLERGNPYSWYVKAKSAQESGPDSETWKLYVAAEPGKFYAPYPAELISPAIGENQTAGKITLTWTGADADNDLRNYDVYFGTSATPPLHAKEITAQKLENVSIIAKTRYYWKVVSRDLKGNTSESELRQFMVN